MSVSLSPSSSATLSLSVTSPKSLALARVFVCVKEADSSDVFYHLGGTNEAFADAFLDPALTRKFAANGMQLDALVAGEVAAVVTDSEEAAWWLHSRQEQESNDTTPKATYCRSVAILPGTGASKALLLPRGDAPFKRYVDFWLKENQAFIAALYQKYLPQTT